jgi:predicted O-methyltransferase YrrM
MEGTYNRQFKVVAKDNIKKLLFYFDRGKAANRRRILEAKDTAELFTICNQVLGVHQSRYEVTELIRFLNTHNRPKVLCEIGTANSGTNLLLGQAVKSAEFIAGIDLYVKNRSRLRYYLWPKKSEQFNGDSKSGLTISNLENRLKGRKIDFLFIDGDHSYEGVKADFEAYLPLMAENGLIAFHDIVPDFKTRFGKDTGMWVGEVPQYWKELKEQYSNTVEIIENPEQDGQGIGLIVLKPL